LKLIAFGTFGEITPPLDPIYLTVFKWSLRLNEF